MKYGEITFNNWHFCGALSIESHIIKSNSYISASLLTLCRGKMSDFCTFVLCTKPMLKEKVSVTNTFWYQQFLDLHRVNLLGGFLFLDTTLSFHWPTASSLLQKWSCGYVETRHIQGCLSLKHVTHRISEPRLCLLILKKKKIHLFRLAPASSNLRKKLPAII